MLDRNGSITPVVRLAAASGRGRILEAIRFVCVSSDRLSCSRKVRVWDASSAVCQTRLLMLSRIWSRGSGSGDLRAIQRSSSPENATTVLLAFDAGRCTGMPSSVSHRCAVRTPRSICSDISFQPLRIRRFISSPWCTLKVATAWKVGCDGDGSDRVYVLGTPYFGGRWTVGCAHRSRWRGRHRTRAGLGLSGLFLHPKGCVPRVEGGWDLWHFHFYSAQGRVEKCVFS